MEAGTHSSSYVSMSYTSKSRRVRQGLMLSRHTGAGDWCGWGAVAVDREVDPFPGVSAQHSASSQLAGSCGEVDSVNQERQLCFYLMDQ